jgi:DNA-binding CsgD family transcriptional regulator
MSAADGFDGGSVQMKMEIELTAISGDKRVLIGRLPLVLNAKADIFLLDNPTVPLTRREIQVRDLMVEGKVRKEIGVELNISASSVKSIAGLLYKKYHVNGRAELLRRLANE